MPELGRIIEALILGRPLCFSCLARKSGMDSVAAVEAALARVVPSVEVHRGPGRCRACGEDTTVLWVGDAG